MRIIATLSQIFVREYQPAIARMLLLKKKRKKCSLSSVVVYVNEGRRGHGWFKAPSTGMYVPESHRLQQSSMNTLRKNE